MPVRSHPMRIDAALPVVAAALVEPLLVEPLLVEPLLVEPLLVEPAVVEPAVVGAGRTGARCDGRRVLVQQRAYPAATVGRWELPGGRVEPGESAHEALIRECREELAVDIIPGERLGPEVPLPGGRMLRVYLARLADPAARPVPVEHAALRWVGAAELAELDWLDADRAVLPDLERWLRDP